MGMLKEDPENTFVLLERAEEDICGKRVPEEWGVSASTFWLPTYSFPHPCSSPQKLSNTSVHRGDVDQPWESIP